MKTLFVYAKYKETFLLNETALDAFAQNFDKEHPIGLCSAINFINSLEGIQKQLQQQGYTVELIKGDHSYEQGQVLGCDMPIFGKNQYQGYLYIGDGAFHPKGMQLHSNLKIFTYNPFDTTFELFTSDAAQLQKKHKAGLSTFLMAKDVGVLVTLKAGQNRYILVDRLERDYPDKKFYPVIYDNLEFNQLNNFPFAQVWVNTMCPRIGLDDTNKIDKPIVNIIDIFDMQQESKNT